MSGRLVLVNGSPSAGKTSLIRELMRRLDHPWYHHNLDRHLLGYDDSQRSSALWNRAVQGYMTCLVALVDAGHDVMSESVLPSGDPDGFVDAVARFAPYVISLRCDLDVVHAREAARERHIGHYFVPAQEHEAVQAWPLWDMALDGTSRTIEDLADEALPSLIARDFVGAAFGRPHVGQPPSR